MHARELRGLSGFRPEGGPSRPAIDLGSNENPLGPSPAAATAVCDVVDSINRYPRDPHAALDRALASRWDVEPAQIWLGPGGVGVFDYLSRTFLEPGDRILEPDPGFFVIGRSARAHHGGTDRYPLDRDAGFAFDVDAVLARYDGHRLIYAITPHNPTGTVASLGAIEAVADATDEETMVVVDEAYGAFTEAPSAVELVRRRSDVAVVRTFSKAYGLAGLRLGYAIVPESVADAYAVFQTPYAASRVACVAARAALDDEAFLERSVAVARKGRRYLAGAIEAETYPSEANFVLVRAGDGQAVADALLERDIRIRNCHGYGLSSFVRVTVGTAEQNRIVARALNEVIPACASP
ncbi:MAG: histidinol-phosphate transaminase [Halobacteriales archaeon]